MISGAGRVLLLLVCLSLACGVAIAGTDFPRSITVVVGFSPGGGDEGGSVASSAAARLQPQPGYDQTARLIARYIGGFLPGSPSVALRNMPGAGSVKAASYLANEAPRDGSVLGVVSSTALLAPLLGSGPVAYAMSSFAFIGGRSSDEYVCAADGEAGVQTLDDLEGREVAFGASAPGRRPYIHVELLKQLTGAPLRIVGGYRDGNEMLLALRRSEISGFCGLSFETVRAGLSTWIANGRLKPLLRLSPPWEEKLRAVPRGQDVALQRGAMPELVQALDFMALEGVLAWTLVAPAGVSEEARTALRSAFRAMQSDRGYLREAARRNLNIETVEVDRIETAVRLMSRTPDDVIAIVKKLNGGP